MKQVLRNLLSNYGVNLGGMVLGFLLVPFLVHTVGREAFGLIVLSESAITFFEIGTISVRVALARHAAYALASGNKNEFVSYLSTGRRMLVYAAFAVLAFGFIAAAMFDKMFRVPAGYESESRLLFCLLMTAFAATVANIGHWSVLYARERFDLINASLSAGLAVRALGIFVAYTVLPPEYRTLGVYGLVYLVMSLVQNGLVRFWRAKLMPTLQLDAAFDPEKAKDILSFGGHTSLSRVNSLLNEITGTILVNLLWGPAANAMYSISMKLPQILKRLFMDTTWTLTPTFTNLAARGERDRFERLFFAYTKLVALATLPIAALLAFFAGPLVRFWVGDGFETAAALLPLHLVPLVAGLPLSVCSCVNNAYAQVRVPSRVGFVAAAANVALALVLGRGFGMGLYGVAAASAVTQLAYLALFTPYYACRVAGLPFGRYVRESLLKPMAVAAALVVLPIAAERSGAVSIDSLAGWSAFSAALGLSYLAGAYLLVLTAEERRKIREAAFTLVPSPKRTIETSDPILAKFGNK